MIIHNFLEFDSRAVESVFNHRTQMFAVPENMTLQAAVEEMIKRPYSRVPVYRKDKDQIV
ncbi:MAG: hypothetical protein H6765_08355 [Candidatus Peribacteria bacterium]|nr:MAG: hypothetical protein H6765_08355 [Candidatus Peribacteria bacterium]